MTLLELKRYCDDIDGAVSKVDKLISQCSGKKKLHKTVSQEVKNKIVLRLSRVSRDIQELEDDNPTFHIIRNLISIADEIGKYSSQPSDK